jgi:hypothetical protein
VDGLYSEARAIRWHLAEHARARSDSKSHRRMSASEGDVVVRTSINKAIAVANGD